MFQPDTLRHLLEEAKPEASPYTLESLEAWLVKQDPTEEYDYCNHNTCAMARYVCGMGGHYEDGRGYVIGNHILAAGRMPQVLRDVVQGWPGTEGRWTLGGALLRTRATIAAKTRA